MARHPFSPFPRPSRSLEHLSVTFISDQFVLSQPHLGQGGIAVSVLTLLLRSLDSTVFRGLD